jgi:transposase-like protein
MSRRRLTEITEEVKKRAVALTAKGEVASVVAVRLGISRHTVRRILAEVKPAKK